VVNGGITDGFEFRQIVKQNSFTQHLEWPYWDNPDCINKFKTSPCQYSGLPLKVMILGDSHGNHLYPGIASSVNPGYGVFSGGTCPPLIGIRAYVDKNQAAHACATADYLSRNFDILDSNSSIKTVVISAAWRIILDGNFLNPAHKEFWGGVKNKSLDESEKNLPNDVLVYLGLKRTISAISQRGKEVIFIRSTPDFSKDITEICIKRFSGDSLKQDCSIPRSIFDARRQSEDRLLSRLIQDFPNLKIFDPYDVLCSREECFLVLNGMPLYRDSFHLSVYGSGLVGKALVHKYGHLF